MPERNTKSVYPGRVNLCFNLNDPVQKAAYDEIADKGRAKSMYISERFKKLREIEDELTASKTRAIAEGILSILRENEEKLSDIPSESKKKGEPVNTKATENEDKEMDILIAGLDDFV